MDRRRLRVPAVLRPAHRHPEPASNLVSMTFDDAARARIARGWMTSSRDQRSYAAQHDISERTLRQWVARYCAGRRPQARLRAAVVASIEQLQNVLAALDAEAADDLVVATEGGLQFVKHDVERDAGSARPATLATVAPVLSEAEPLASVPKVLDADADGPEDVHHVVAVREAAGSDVAASAQEMALQAVDGAGPAAAPCRRPTQSVTNQQGQGTSQVTNDTPHVVDL